MMSHTSNFMLHSCTQRFSQPEEDEQKTWCCELRWAMCMDGAAEGPKSEKIRQKVKIKMVCNV